MTIRMTTNWFIEVNADVQPEDILIKCVQYLQENMKTKEVSVSIIEQSIKKSGD